MRQSHRTQITTSDDSERFADPTFDVHANRLIAIRERHSDDQEAVNDLVAIDLASNALEVLHHGHDFYAHARLSPNGEKLAFLAWDHPNMPWNGTQLYLTSGQPDAPVSLIAGGQTESICQLEWLTNEDLIYCSDVNGFYDLMAYTSEGTYPIVSDGREYGHAMWQLGSTQFEILNDKLILATPDHAEITVIEAQSGFSSSYEDPVARYRDLVKYRDGYAFVQSNVNETDAIRVRDSFLKDTRTIFSGGSLPIGPAYISEPELVTFPGSNDEDVHAFFYAPQNPDFSSPRHERPPLLVQAHGGPTSSTSPTLSLNIQFYTSRGWAVLDVNYSGSTGYGRAYRERLNLEWGNRDVQDLAAGVRYLIAQDRIDPQRVAIAGGSAGGYTVLRALTTTSVFKVGASHYGIADLRALVSDTHKFESRYIDQLVPADAIDDRSPIHHVDNLNCPVIFSQGLEDKVVPPSQSRMMFEALKEKGIPTALFMFEGEAHGFRKLENRVACLKGDYYFFSRVFGFEPVGIDGSALTDAETAHMDSL